MVRTRIIEASKLIFCAALLAAVSGYQAFSQIETQTSVSSASMIAASTTSTAIYLYTSESEARERLSAEIRRGKSARMYYDQSRSRWIVEVKG